jgi:CheY-like chemotaxis protein
VKQILTFSRRTEQGKRPLRLIPLAKETMKLLRATLPTTIRIDFDIQTTSDTVLADPSQMQQVLMNLATNGAYAMRRNGGVLTVRLSDVLFTESEDKPDVHMAPGHYLKLTVQDTGPGMSEAVREHIFEPFFTTKPPGHGTGMGLPVVYGIVKGHKGAIVVESALERGSTFSIFLPLAKGKARQERKEEGRTPRGSEKILLVDDEPEVVSTTSSMLRRLGYQVTTAETGPEALNIFLADPRSFDLVITDETMPDITGTALTQKMLQLRADIPVILFTGHSETVSAEKARQAGVRAFLMKPVARAEMAEVIRRVLKPPHA